MKTIINNPDKLNEKEIDITTNKVRAIILDNSNNIIITKYADMFMLPGGKVEKNESCENALIRELKEELGMNFEVQEITPFIKFENYIKNYRVVNSNNEVNKLNKTIYYIIKTNKKFDKNKIELSEKEKENNFSVTYLSLLEIIDTVSNYNSSNIRNLYFKTELIKVLEEYINNNKLIDLHTHTCFSDGELFPNDLVRYAKENGIDTIAITDHDTIKGIKQLDRNDFLIVNNDIKVIDGIELSAKTDKGRMHILGYGIDIHNEKLNNKLNELRLNSLYSVLSLIIQIKNDYGITFSYDEIKDLVNTNGNLGRPDIARLCLKNGYATGIQDAFDKYLIDAYKKTKQNNKGIPYQECIKLIIDSGGIPVLAHPKSLDLNDLELLYLLKDMINCGLMGIEVYHSSHSKEETDKYFKLANELGLLISGGSDYHGINTKPDVEIGTGINNNLKIKSLSILDKIKR